MSHCFIVSTDLSFINATAKFVEKHSYHKPVKVKLRDNEYFKPIELYKCISETFSSISYTDLRESVVLVDEYFNLPACQPIEHDINSNIFWGRMILSFPELEFLFLNKTVQDSRTITDWIDNERKVEKNSAFLPLFDYSGFRSLIRNNCGVGLLQRTGKARIIEDELSYAYFHGYIAYKRHHTCKMYTLLNHLLQEKSKANTEVDLQIQDLSLGFMDKRDNLHILDLADRYKEFDFLKMSKDDKKKENNSKDFVVTTGQNSKKINGQKEYINIMDECLTIVEKATNKRSIILKGKTDKHDFFYVAPKGKGDEQSPSCSICGLPTDVVQHLKKGPEVLYKPTKGMYEIEKRLGLDKACKPTKAEQSNYPGHSAPGILALIAENLIGRSQYILDNAKQVIDAIHAATLALEAKELLNGLNPTLALQAYTLQQKAEVTAECLFVGTEYNVELDMRFRDIETEVVSIVERFADSQRVRVQRNIQLTIVQALSGIYGHYKQFEEELNCLNEARRINFKLKSKVLQPIKRSLNWSMKGPVRFAVVLILVQIIFGIFYFILFKHWTNSSLQPSLKRLDWQADAKLFLISLVAATKYYFTSESTEMFGKVFKEHELGSSIVLGLQGFCSLVGVSLFMAMIYLRISRK